MVYSAIRNLRRVAVLCKLDNELCDKLTIVVPLNFEHISFASCGNRWITLHEWYLVEHISP